MKNNMKYLFYILCLFCLFSCIDEKRQKLDEKRIENRITDTKSLYYEGKNLDDLYRCTLTYKKYPDGTVHKYYLYEFGTKGTRNYSFCLEHIYECPGCMGSSEIINEN